jgi:hypothetical protein
VFGLEVLNEQATSTDNNYNGLSGPPVYVTVEGSDTTTLGSVVLSKDHLEVTRGGAGDSYTVALASQPAGDVTITVTQVDENVPPPVPLSLATTNDSTPPSTGPNDPLVITPTTLTFTAADWNTPQTVTVSPPTTGSGDQSDWLVETAASTADPSYNLRLPTIGVSVIDPSAEQAGLVLSKDSLDVTAGGTGDSYTVALASKPTGTVTVTISQVEVPPPLANPSGNVEWPADGSTPTTLTITPTTLTFTADDWSTPQTVQVSAPAPATGSAPGSGFEFDLLQQQVASSDPNYDGLHSAPVFVRVRDSSTTANPAGLVLSKEELTVTPGGTGDSYTVALASQPTGDVTITIDQVNAVPPPPGPAATGAVVGVPIPIGGDTQLTVTPSTLTFTADNWSKPQTVQVSAPAPTDPTAPGVSQVEWLIQTVASSDANYNNLFVPPLGVAVVSPGQPVPTVPPVIPPPTGGAPVNVPGIAPPPVIVLPFIPAQPPHALQSSVTIHGTGNTGSHGGSKPTGTPHAPGTGAPASHPKATTHRGKHGKKPHRGKH